MRCRYNSIGKDVNKMSEIETEENTFRTIEGKLIPYSRYSAYAPVYTLPPALYATEDPALRELLHTLLFMMITQLLNHPRYSTYEAMTAGRVKIYKKWKRHPDTIRVFKDIRSQQKKRKKIFRAARQEEKRRMIAERKKG
jgi:hypothetical protein